jgi:PAS domain S-box-containing protein
VVVGVNTDYVIVYVNATACATFGYPNPSSLTGQSLSVLIPMDQRAVHRSRFDAWLKNPRSMPMGMSPIQGLTSSGKTITLMAGLWLDKDSETAFTLQMQIPTQKKWWARLDFACGTLLLITGVILELGGSTMGKQIIGTGAGMIGVVAGMQVKSKA